MEQLAGHKLRSLREQLGYTMRDVESAGAQLAARYRNEEFGVPPSRLSDIETKGVVPSIFRLYALAIIYRRDYRELMMFYGIDLDRVAADLEVGRPPKTHATHAVESASVLQVPVRFDPNFDLRYSANLGRMIEQWGLVPIAYLSHFDHRRYTYGYVGAEDYTMYPLLPPGTFLQVDETKNKVQDGGWRSEYERPIYFVETRAGHTACWCALSNGDIILQPHPLSPVATRVLKHPSEAEVLGQVVGVATRIGGSNLKEREVQNRDVAGQPLPGAPATDVLRFEAIVPGKRSV